MQSISINGDKIDKSALYQGKSGTYLNLTLMENREGPDQYGNDGFVVQDISKERRQAGERGPIIGNWKYIGGGKQQASQLPPGGGQRNNQGAPPSSYEDDQDIPF